MWNQLLPRQADNTYRGHKLALWLLGIVVLLRVLQSVNSMINGHAVLVSADGIPLDTFPAAAAQTIVSLFALSAMRQLALSLLCVLVLVRYRALVPLMFTFLLLQYAGGRLVLQAMPIPRVGAPPASIINYIFLALMAAGLLLSLWRPRRES